MANWAKLRFVAEATQRFSHPSEKFSDSEVWKEKRFEICFTHNKTANLFGFKNISKYGYRVWQESGFYVEGENELMVKSALIRYAAGGFFLSREKRETIQNAVKQGWLFSDIEQELNIEEERRKTTVITSIQPINFEPETVLHDAETQATPEPEPVKKIRIVEEIPEYNIPLQINSSSDKRFTFVILVWGSIAFLLAIATIISVVMTHASGVAQNSGNVTYAQITTTPAPIINSADCVQALTRCARCNYIYGDGFVQRKCLECAGNFFLNAEATCELKCTETITGCGTCDSNNRCAACSSNQRWLEAISDSCVLKSICYDQFQNCGNCADSTDCIACYDGYEFNSDHTQCITAN